MSNDPCGAVGVVTSIEGGFVTVRLSSGECASCGCGCRGGNAPEIRLKAPPGLSVGDKVSLSLPEGKALKYSALFYGLPLVFMTVTAVIAGPVLGLPEIAAASAALVSVPPAWLIVKKLTAKEKYPGIIKAK